MTDVNFGTVYLVLLGFVILVAWFNVCRVKRERLRIKNEAELAREKERQERKLQDQQDNLGNRFFNAMVKAASSNPSGRTSATKLPNNGGDYTIIVTQHDSHVVRSGIAYRSNPIVSIDVNLMRADWKIHTFVGPYGPDTYYKLSDGVEGIIATLSKMVTEYGIRIA